MTSLAIGQAPAGATTSYTVNASDAMSRSTSSGLGVASVGGEWTTAPAGLARMGHGFASIGPIDPGRTFTATLPAVSAVNEKLDLQFSMPSIPSSGVGLYLQLLLRRQRNGDAMAARAIVGPGGSIRLTFLRLHSGAPAQDYGSVTLPNAISANTPMRFEAEVNAQAPVTAIARIWPAAATAPAWQLAKTFPSTALTAAGSVGFQAYTSTSTKALRMQVDSFTGWRQNVEATPAPASGASSASPAPASSSASRPVVSPVPSRSTSASPSPSTSASASTSQRPSPSQTSTAPTSSASAPDRGSSGAAAPDANNTGVPNGTKLTVYNGDLRITRAGATYSNLDVHGFVAVDAPNVTITNSIIRGAPATSSKCLVVDSTGAGTGLVITNSELVPAYPSQFVSGLCGWNFRAVALKIHGGVDGVDINGPDATIKQSYIYDTVVYQNSVYHDNGPTHNDSVQVTSGSDIRIVGNTLVGGNNSAIQITQDHGAVSNLTIDGNWISGGTCSVKMNNKPMGAMGGIAVTSNDFGRGQSIKNCAVLGSMNTSFTDTGNTWHDSHQEISAVHYG